MKPQGKLLKPLLRRPSGLPTKLAGGVIALFLCCIAATSARAQFTYWTGYVPERYVIIQTVPVNDVDSAYEYSPQPVYYLYDYVNRASALTPEPIWRSMFPGAASR